MFTLAGQKGETLPSAEEFWTIMCSRSFPIPAFWDLGMWDTFMYEVMCLDSKRLTAYRRVIEATVKGKTVVEIGAGAALPLSLMCVQAGASLVYAIESDPIAAAEARSLVSRLNLTSLHVLEGDSRSVELPSKADVCVSELLGGIGSSEGVLPIINDARRFLTKDGIFIPYKCQTLMAPVKTPAMRQLDPRVQRVIDHHMTKASNDLGFLPTFTRFEYYNFPAANMLADAQEFEVISFPDPPATAAEVELLFDIYSPGSLDGFLFWINLHVDQATSISSWRQTSWAPILIPVPGPRVDPGDKVHVSAVRKLGQNQMNPDYYFNCNVVHRNGETESFFQASPWLPC